MTDDLDGSLIPVPSGELAVPASGRIVANISEDILALVLEATPAVGDLDALVQEGKRIRRREGMCPEDVRAFQLFLQAAEAGHAEAQYLVFECYRDGNGTGGGRPAFASHHFPSWIFAKWGWTELETLETPEAPVAIGWLKKSAESGFADAQEELAICYEHGYGGEIDFKKAVGWHRLAAEQGHAGAQHSVGVHYGAPPVEDHAEAVKWYRKAAEQGDSCGQMWFGLCHYYGKGVQQDFVEAVKWLRKAAEQGNGRGRAMLGLCYYKGEGLEQDFVEAVKCFGKAAEQDDNLGRAMLGRCYRDGHGVAVDSIEAYAWLKLAEYCTPSSYGSAALPAGMSGAELKLATERYEELKATYRGNSLLFWERKFRRICRGI